MRPLCGVPLLLLLLLTCQLATPTPIFDRDGAGLHSGHRSAAFGESIREWFRMMKDRIVGKWQEWFGDDEIPTPRLSPQDILNIDKTLEKRIQGYPSILTDLWEKYGPDCETDEWDFKSWIPAIPSFSDFDWPNIFGKPELPTTVTPRTESTTVRRETTVSQTEQPSVLTTTTAGTTVSIAESTVTPIELTPPITQVTTAASTEPTVTSTEEISTSNESTVTNGESTVSTIESIATSTEPTLISAERTTTSATESITTTDESESSATSSTEPISPSTESIVTANESTMTPVSEEVTIIESPTTPFDLALPVYSSKRVEDNETIEQRTARPKNRSSSAEVIMF